MLSKCANPTCFARFRYLREGKTFNIEIKKDSGNVPAPFSGKIEHFWLCESCARVMKVVQENGVVSTRLLYPELPAGTPEKDQARSEMPHKRRR